MRKINLYRKQIDKIDKEIIKLLGKRYLVVKKIWEEKKRVGLPALDKKRFFQVLGTRMRWAKLIGVDEVLVKNIFKLIHKQSLKIEK